MSDKPTRPAENAASTAVPAAAEPPDPAVDAARQPADADDSSLALAHRGRFDLGDELGRGGMGLVIAAHDRGLQRDVAMKVLQPGLQDRPGFDSALRREARVLGSLEHPAIVPLYELGVHPDGQSYYTMRRVGGSSLGAVLRRLQLGDVQTSQAWPLRRLVQVFIQIAQGMNHAHGRGVVHRDLTPDNILLGELGEVQICDWGTAKRLQHEPAADGVVPGSPVYMSPEQAAGRDRDVDGRADIYALGVMLYEALTLRRPYGGETSQQQLEACQNVVPLPPSTVARDRVVPPDLEVLCLAMLQKKPARRPQTMREVYEALEAFLAGDLQRQRLLERADESYAKGLEALAQADSLRVERDRVAREIEDLTRQVRPWHGHAAKQHLLAVRQQAELLEVLFSQAFSMAVEHLRQAIDQGEGHPQAKATLIDIYWHRHDEAAAQGDTATKLFYARQAHALEGGNQRTGTVHIRSQPLGARIFAIPMDEVRENLEKPAADYELGLAPIVGATLPVGPYVLLARLDGHRDAMATVFLREDNRDVLLLCHPWSSELPRSGREVELRRLWQLLEDVGLRARPMACLVSAAQGMGKNSLLDTFRGQVEQHPTKLFFLLEVSCSRLRRDLPYAAVVDMVRLRAGVLDSDSAEQARAKLRRMVRYGFAGLGRRAVSPEREQQADLVADTIAALPAFDIGDPGRMGAREEMTEGGRQRIAAALAEYFQQVAQTTPVLMLIRNAQYMDPSSRRFLAGLYASVQDVPILIVASSTEADDSEPLLPTPIDAERALLAGQTVPRGRTQLAFDDHLSLPPISDVAVQSLVRDMLAGPVRPELVAWVQHHAEGNPLLAGELVQLLARTGAMAQSDGVWRSDAAQVPRDLQLGDLHEVMRRVIATLPTMAQEVLATAAVVGAEFWLGALRALGHAQPGAALDALLQAGLVVRSAGSRYARDHEYHFASELRRRVAYDLVPLDQRRAVHRQLAAWMVAQGRTDLEESLRLAHHLELGGQPEEAALLYARIARAATTVGAEEEAERLWTRAHVLSNQPDLLAHIEAALRSAAWLHKPAAAQPVS